MKKGISLVALVITIIVLIIITGAIVLTLVNTSLLDKADNAVKEHSLQEVYSAVQREVLAVQNENIGEPVGDKFVEKLQEKLEKRFPNGELTIKYYETDDEIAIIYDSAGKTYDLVLNNKYQLKMAEDIELTGIEAERKILLQILESNFNGQINFEQLKTLLPENWSISETESIYDTIPVYTDTENTFYLTENGFFAEQIGVEQPTWLYENQGVEYLGKDTSITLADTSVLSNVYKKSIHRGDVIRYTKISDITAVDIIKLDLTNSNVENIQVTLTNLQIARLPQNLQTISDNAFKNCKKLYDVIIPNTVTNIGDYAFYTCIKLTSITIPTKVESIGQWSFCGCKLIDLTIPSSTKSIGEFAFAYSSTLTNLTIENGVETIRENAFNQCSKLESIILPRSITSIESGAFYRCEKVKTIILDGCITDIGQSAFACSSGLENLTLKNGIKNIGELAFSNCKKLKEVVIPGSVNLIDDFAFSDCYALEKLTIEKGVQRIGNRAFDNASIKDLVIPNSVCYLADYAFSILELENLTVPSSVKTINGNPFKYCSNLKNITVGSDTLKNIFKNWGISEDIITVDTSIN